MRVKKFFKSLGVVVAATAMVIASAPVAQAADGAKDFTMEVAPNIETEKNAGQMSGVSDLELPAAELLKPREDENKSSGDSATYPSETLAQVGNDSEVVPTDESFDRVGERSDTSILDIIKVTGKDEITLTLDGYGSVEGVDEVKGGEFDGYYPYNPENPSFEVAANLNNGIVKDILNTMTKNVDPKRFYLSGVDGTFIATINLGKLNVVDDHSYKLLGSEETYSVDKFEVKPGENGNVLEVIMKLNKPEEIKTVADLRDALNDANSDLKLTFHVGTPTENTVDIPGTFNGCFKANYSLSPNLESVHPFKMKYESGGRIKLFKPISANFYPEDPEYGSVSVPSVVLISDTGRVSDFTPSSVATPKDGYRFVNWTHNGKVVSAVPELKLQKDSGEDNWYGHEGDYIAHFEKIPYGDVIVHYVDEQGNKIKDNVVVVSHKEVGIKYDTKDSRLDTIDFKGSKYILVPEKTKGNETGEVVEGTTDVTYVYKKQTTKTPQQKPSTPKKDNKKHSPETGDTTNIGLIAAIGVAGLALVIKAKKEFC